MSVDNLIKTFLDPKKGTSVFKDNNDQISNAINNGASAEQAYSAQNANGQSLADYNNGGRSYITQQMQMLMGNSLFQENKVGKLGNGNNITHDGQTQCGIYTVATGGRAKIDIDLNNDGEISEDEKGVDAAQAMAASFDSELDLYIEDSIQKFIEQELNCDTSFWWDGRGFMTEAAQRKLKEEYGIVVTQVGEDRRTYSFSLVDEEGNVVEDAEGNKASILWGDWVIPDGFAQGAELNLSSILDTIGYDCVSKADFVTNEELGGKEVFDQMIDAFHKDAANLLNLTNSSAYTGEQAQYMKKGEHKLEQIYGKTEIISLWSGGGSASPADLAVLNALIQMAQELGIDATEFTKEEDDYKEAKDKITKALKEAGKTDEEIKEAENKGAAKNLEDAVKEYEERLEQMTEENPDTEVDTKELAEQIAKEFDIEIDTLLDEIK